MFESVRLHFKQRYGEWIVALATVGWGVMTILHPDLFSKSFLYDGLLKTLPQNIWALLAISIGSFRLLFLFINGTLRRSPHLRAVGSGLSVYFWTSLLLSFGIVEILSTALPTIAIPIALDFRAIWNAASEAKISDNDYNSSKTS